MPYAHFKLQVFFRAGGLSQLEDIRDEKLTGTIVSLQAKCRGYISRRKLQKLKVNGHYSVSKSFTLTLAGPYDSVFANKYFLIGASTVSFKMSWNSKNLR